MWWPCILRANDLFEIKLFHMFRESSLIPQILPWLEVMWVVSVLCISFSSWVWGGRHGYWLGSLSLTPPLRFWCSGWRFFLFFNQSSFSPARWNLKSSAALFTHTLEYGEEKTKFILLRVLHKSHKYIWILYIFLETTIHRITAINLSLSI